MEHNVPQNQTNQNFVEVAPSIQSANSQNKLIPFLGIVVVTAAVGVGGYLVGMQSAVQNVSQQNVTASPLPITETNDQPVVITEMWKTARYGGIFSYEYPAGWHVVELWPEGFINEQGISIIINSSPISTAPRGGSIGTFQINVLSGLQNPDEVFLQKKAEFNSERYTDIQTETLESDLGPIEYFKGKMIGPMFEGEVVEKYFLTFNQQDPMNQQIITASLEFNKDPKLSEMLRHIVLSLEEPQDVIGQ